MKIFKIITIIIILSITSFILIRKVGNGYHTVLINNTEFKVKIADNKLEWSTGLMDTIELEEKEGMLFIFPDKEKRSFWMKNMNFPIDLLWIQDGIIVGMEKNMIPDDGIKYYNSINEVNMVLELNTGDIDKYNLEINNIINIK